MKAERFIMGVAQLLPVLAQGEEQSTGQQGSIWGGLFWTLLPIIIMVPILVVVIRRIQKPILRRNQEHMERQVQHMERVEQSLQRIIKAVEKSE